MKISPPRIEFSLYGKPTTVSTRYNADVGAAYCESATMICPEENEVVFDSDRLLNPPKVSFACLSISDFDLYCATACYIATHIGLLTSVNTNAAISINRIERTFRIKLIWKESNRGISCPIYNRNGNVVSIELAMKILNSTFCLIGERFISYNDSKMVEGRIKDMFFDALFVYRNFPIRYFEGNDCLCPLDVLLVLRNILINLGHTFTASDTDWFRRRFRGWRNNLLFEHPELFF